MAYEERNQSVQKGTASSHCTHSLQDQTCVLKCKWILFTFITLWKSHYVKETATVQSLPYELKRHGDNCTQWLYLMVGSRQQHCNLQERNAKQHSGKTTCQCLGRCHLPTMPYKHSVPSLPLWKAIWISSFCNWNSLIQHCARKSNVAHVW